jgi:hypothetical protein
MYSDAENLDHTENPYGPLCLEFEETARPFLDAYLPALVSVLSFTWDVEDSLAPAYLAQTVVLISHQFGSEDVRTDMRAVAWELADHARILNAISPIMEPHIPDEVERCRCGMDHKLEATALATFLERAIAGDNASAVKVLDALWEDMKVEDFGDTLHVGASLLGHVVGGMVFAHLHSDCDHGHGIGH